MCQINFPNWDRITTDNSFRLNNYTYTTEVEVEKQRCTNKECSAYHILKDDSPFCCQCGKKTKKILCIEIHHYHYNYSNPFKWEQPVYGSFDINPPNGIIDNTITIC